MKTEQIMLRDLNGVSVRQAHKSGFFNANDLLALYRKENPSDQRDISDYQKQKSAKSFRQTVIKDILQNTPQKSISIEAITSQDLPIAEMEVEEDDLVSYSKRGKNGGTWMHPYIFMDFAMWLSSSFKLTCIKWLYDRLIQVRDEAGDSFKLVNDALHEQKPSSPYFVYANEASMINKLVFGSTVKDQRNKASEEQLELLKKLQKADVKLIQEGVDFHDRYEALKQLKKYF